MRPGRRRQPRVLMLGLAALAGASPAEDTPKGRASAVLEAAARDGFSGTVCVERGGQTLVDRALGWADLERTRRADPDTLYHVASVTRRSSRPNAERRRDADLLAAHR